MSREESALLASMILFSATALMATNYTRQKQTKHEKDLRNNTNNAKKLVRYLSDRPAWQSYNDDDELFIREFPKIELHVHLDGSFDPDFLWRYTQDNPDLLACLPVSTDLPWDRGQTLAVRDMVQKCQTQREFHQLCSCRGRRSLKAMLNCFEIFLPLVRRNLDLLEQLAFDFCKRQWEQNTIYTEVRYSPHLLAESYHKDIDKGDAKMVDAEAVYQAITRGLRHGCNKFPGIVVNQILCAITWRPDWAMPTVAMVHAHRNDFPCAAVGVDIAAGETHFDKENYPDLYEPHMDMIKEAVAKKIPITIHAGESTEHATDNVRRAVLEYQANRIGHGYGMVKNESIMQLVKEKNVHVEVCPTSSDETGGWSYEKKQWHKHPCVTMKAKGVSFSFSSDDPAVFHTSLAWQFRVALARMELTKEDLLKANLEAINAAFCSDEVKEHMRKELCAYGREKLTYERIDNARVPTKKQTHPYRRAMSEGFVDRVHLTKSQYF